VDGETSRRFWIENDAFSKDGEQFQIVGGDVHYFRIIPEVNPFPTSLHDIAAFGSSGVEWLAM
jgi:beta-galactosidase